MELNGFMIGPEIKKLFKIKVVTPTARHPVDTGRRKRHTNLKDSQELVTIQSVPEHSGRRKRNSEQALIFVE